MMKIVQLNLSRLCCCFTFLISLLKRAMCFVSGHKRTNSDPGIPVNTDTLSKNEIDLDWDDWGDGSPISIKIDPTIQKPTNQNEEEEEIDYFSGMVPSFKKPKIIRKKMVDQSIEVAPNHSAFSNRLSVNSSVVLPENPELSNWDDSNENAWDEESSNDLVWEADQVIKQQKQAEREQRLAEHQRRKHEKEMQRESRREASRLAVKLK
ncbi:receptor-binding cancer antigen expressed on SiSo cells-like [Anneissia japonica]|uniref:receptor-binding cancer antigen expressed on SiSo cells-like n=1 Tax=Anneissia japonica TaxID=1529436 RepID=UPI0014254F76|nr:receptor-binding cancer antigen expressed on SiSo cells-like [Anneissia japonica]